MTTHLDFQFGMLKSEFFPAQEADSKRLLVGLHGLGDSSAGYRWLPQILSLPWLNYLLVNAPDPYYEGFSWYDFAGDPAPGVKRSREFLFRLMDDLGAKGHAPEEMIVFGFSQGCLMTWELGLRYPHKFAGLIGISGYVHEPEHALKELSPVAKEQKFLITHGAMDPIIPFDQVKQQIARLKQAGLQIEWHEFPKAHMIGGRDEIAVIRQFIVDRFG